ncbi:MULTISPECIES: hypothetical protein [Aeromonas]|uniref:Uncharacterized protein n=1 Tax=Aeromonas caviae TaxID=648 RepID=A0AAV4YJH6_AERCA|nr:hypothetical protein [Aeromonas caviae]HDT6079387.1 hypothetical protein [Aeromonas veronii bv. veronii]MDX7611429.1 hypothetical protein [Aeromonas caviae]GJA13366.1 hypothetical protein KAM335_05620 [Aeromonas caviae]GJA40855.1 hypothetical protein KAM343_16510 [Aeromonas caviae]GJA76580.1 hypothetical protein KAM354_18160 [Aeromonas caviae]
MDLLPLRCHSDNNRKQHQRFLDDVAEVSEQHQAWIVVYAICPCCDLYALGMDLETGYPFTEVDGQTTTIHELTSRPEWRW